MKKKVVIVGGGINGLTAANYLQKHNFNVHILEKNNIWYNISASNSDVDNDMIIDIKT